MSRYDVIIVGAGHNGLSAAHYLAEAGLKILILEMRSVSGGVAITEELFPGFFGNVATNAAHSFDPGIMEDMHLDKHGLRFEAAEPGSLTLFAGGRRVVGWRDRDALCNEIKAFSASDGEAYLALMNDLKNLGDALNVSFFEPPPAFSELAGRLRTKEQERLFAKAVFGSSADLVSEYFTSPEMQSSMGLISVGGLMAGPYDSGSAYPLLHRALNRGSRTAGTGQTAKTPGWAAWNKFVPLGGIGAITRAMERSVISSGVKIRHNAKVAQIKCDKHFVEGVVLENGEEVHSRIVLSNLHPAATLLNLVPSAVLPAQYRGEVKMDVTDGCMSKVYLALDGQPQFACAKDATENSVFQVAGFRTAIGLPEAQRAADGAAEGLWHQHPIMYGVIASAIDPSMAPPGKHIMSLSVSGSPFSLKGTNWKAERDRWARHVIDELNEFIPNIKDLIIDYTCRTPADLEAEFGLFRGEITHGKLTSDRLFGWGPIEGRRNHVAPIPGLYFCGVGTWPGNYCSAIPGRNAAMKVIGDIRSDARDGRRESPGGRNGMLEWNRRPSRSQ
jgi:phytoene dehydrogenase-like protein